MRSQCCIGVNIELHDPATCPMKRLWVQARYLVHGLDDVMWTDNLEDAITYLREDLRKREDETSSSRRQPCQG